MKSYFIKKLTFIFFGTEFAYGLVSDDKLLELTSYNLFKFCINMSIKPLADRVLVKPAAAEEKTVGGI
ncbi:MAG: hypothetical protein VB079_08445, partial [Petrimonas sp.]|nr:hypothetical protein [Petrimonas sp.]